MLQVETYYLIIKSYSMREKSDSLTKFYEETAEKLGIEETVVKEVIENYYTSIKHAMEDFSHEKIVIPKIGTFYVNCIYLKKKINKYKIRLSYAKKESRIEQFTKYKERAEYLFDRYKGTWKLS